MNIHILSASPLCVHLMHLPNLRSDRPQWHAWPANRQHLHSVHLPLLQETAQYMAGRILVLAAYQHLNARTKINLWG